MMKQESSEKKKLIVLIILGVLAVLSLIRGILTPSPVRHQLASVPAETVMATEPDTPRLVVTPLARSSKKSNYNNWGRNPFVIAQKAGVSAGELNLGGILWDKDKPMAVINDNMVGIGDTIEGYKVVSITQDSVVLNDGTEAHTLKLGF